MQQSRQLLEIEVLTQKVLASEIDDGAVLGFAILVAKGLNQAHIFVRDPVAASGSDHAQEHGLPLFCPCLLNVFVAIRKNPDHPRRNYMQLSVPTKIGNLKGSTRNFNYLDIGKRAESVNMRFSSGLAARTVVRPGFHVR